MSTTARATRTLPSPATVTRRTLRPGKSTVQPWSRRVASVRVSVAQPPHGFAPAPSAVNGLASLVRSA